MIMKKIVFIYFGILAVAIIYVNASQLTEKICNTDADCGENQDCSEVKSCTNKICKCKEGYTSRHSNNIMSCFKTKKLGDACDRDQNTCGIEDARCSEAGKCECVGRYYKKDGICVFNETCSNGNNCYDECVNGKCVCPQNYERYGSECIEIDRKKKMTLNVGAVCLYDSGEPPFCKLGTFCEQCPDENKYVCRGDNAAGHNAGFNIFTLAVLTVMKASF